MSTSIATITLLNQSVKSVTSDNNNHTIILNDAVAPIMVNYWAKEFVLKEGNKINVIGKPLVYKGKSLVVEANLVDITDSTGVPSNQIMIATNMNEPYERKNPKAPLKFGMPINHYNRATREKETVWFNVNLWGVTPDSNRMKILQKGNTLMVTGVLEAQVYNNVLSYSISARSFDLIPMPKARQEQAPQDRGGYPISDATTKADGRVDMPF